MYLLTVIQAIYNYILLTQENVNYNKETNTQMLKTNLVITKGEMGIGRDKLEEFGISRY